MPSRDDFPIKIRQALALRAGHICSFTDCGQSTAGPSDESQVAVTMVGVAAHIHAAAPGGPRYLASMTTEERSSIENAIWMCAHHSVLIDRDETTYTHELLRRMKSERESSAKASVARLTAGNGTAQELIALGPELIAIGDLAGADGTQWHLRLKHFISGDLRTLISFGEDFDSFGVSERYVLVGSLGDGRCLGAPPRWERRGDGLSMSLSVLRSFPRKSADELGADLKIGRTGGLVTDPTTGDLVLVSGRDGLYQRIWSCLSWQKGRQDWAPNFGARIAEYELLFRGTPWLESLIKLETIRLATIPYEDERGAQYTPFMSVDRIRSLNLLTTQEPNGISFHLELDATGIGRWADDFLVRIDRERARLQLTKSSIGTPRSHT